MATASIPAVVEAARSRPGADVHGGSEPKRSLRSTVTLDVTERTDGSLWNLPILAQRGPQGLIQDAGGLTADRLMFYRALRVNLLEQMRR